MAPSSPLPSPSPSTSRPPQQQPQKDTLGVSTAGHRTRKRGLDDTLQQATTRALEDVEKESTFFDQVEPYVLPSFESSEIGIGDFLGKGEFGEVLELGHIHVEFDCPCDSCDQQEELQQQQPSPPKSSRIETAPRCVSPIQIIVDETSFFQQQSSQQPQQPQKENEKEGEDQPTLTAAAAVSSSSASALNTHRRVASTVSFANDLGLAADDDNERNEEQQPTTFSDPPVENVTDANDDSTLSTSEDEESVTNMLEDEDTDGEGTFLKGYMSTHLTRQGIARYAIKRIRTDFSSEDTKLDAVVDLAVEAKFLATVRHPNVVRMRGTVGSPGTVGFMIIMDRLKMTLREKMAEWNAESKGKAGLLGKLMGKNNETMLLEQYADKLLAVYDVARAVKYLHNHRIIFRDLKPENVGLDVRGDMRLFDFGLVKELKAKDLVEPPDSFKATGLVGSRRYMAPEVVACKNYGLKADVYSFAIVFWEVFSGKEAYSKMSFDKHFDQVVIKGKRPSSKIAAATTRHLSKSMLHLMPEMWSADPKDRPTFANICDRISGDCILSSLHGTPKGIANRDSDLSHQSHLTDRTRYLMNRSLRSRMHSMDLGGDSSESGGPPKVASN